MCVKCWFGPDAAASTYLYEVGCHLQGQHCTRSCVQATLVRSTWIMHSFCALAQTTTISSTTHHHRSAPPTLASHFSRNLPHFAVRQTVVVAGEISSLRTQTRINTSVRYGTCVHMQVFVFRTEQLSVPADAADHFPAFGMCQPSSVVRHSECMRIQHFESTTGAGLWGGGGAACKCPTNSTAHASLSAIHWR